MPPPDVSMGRSRPGQFASNLKTDDVGGEQFLAADVAGLTHCKGGMGQARHRLTADSC